MTTSTDQALSLKVHEAATRDVGRAIARIDPEHIAALGCATGDTIKLTSTASNKSTVCRVMPTFPADRANGHIHIDGVTRENIAVGIDDPISISPITCKPATSIAIEPLSRQPAQRDLEHIASLLDALPVSIGDRIRVTLFGSGAADFRVTKLAPQSPAMITADTRLELITNKNTKEPQKSGIVSYEDIGGLR